MSVSAITRNSRNRIRISTEIVRHSGFKPGQKVAVRREKGGSLTVVPVNSMPARARVARYTVESNGSIRMSSRVLGGRRNLDRVQINAGHKQIKIG